ncbi:MAG: hypothetical protein IPJ74_10295 [Saprospiraceae bacterium]|nr:hypothetical protein [Saprospiraceae bacterium]
MKKLILSLCSMLLVLTLVAQTKQKTPNGWEYTVLQESKGKKVTRDNAIEWHVRFLNANGELLQSTYEFGLPNYSNLKDVPDSTFVFSSEMGEGGKYAIKVPLKEAGFPPEMQMPGDHAIIEMEIVKILPPLPSMSQAITKILEKESADAAFQQFNKFINESSNEVYISENEVNAVGYLFLQAEKTQEAISIFKYNVKMNTNSANAYDSLGEALAAAGEKKAAIDNYKKSLELNPKNENAKKMIADLEKQ